MAVRGLHLIILGVAAAAVTVCGCAGQLAGPTESGPTLRLLAEDPQASGDPAGADDVPSPPAEPSGSYVAIGDDDSIGDDDNGAESISPLELATEQRQPGSPAESTEAEVSVRIVAQTGASLQQVPPAEEAEEVITPAPAPESRFKAQPPEDDFDRFGRQIADVPVDIRPSEGALPEDVGAEKFAADPTIDETFPSDQPADIYCSYTPWTICYRPLYFEDIGLERYGKNVGCLQTGLSGARFFVSVAALPYKMTRRPPRSCECSNGFSRPGDCPLPGYGNRRFEWDAALVEAAVVTGFVYFIP